MRPKYGFCPECDEPIHNRGAHAEACTGRIIVTDGELPRPRWRRQLRAHAQGYFWLPCPICGEMFAGFESGDVGIKDETCASNERRIACQRHRYAA